MAQQLDDNTKEKGLEASDKRVLSISQ